MPILGDHSRETALLMTIQGTALPPSPFFTLSLSLSNIMLTYKLGGGRGAGRAGYFPSPRLHSCHSHSRARTARTSIERPCSCTAAGRRPAAGRQALRAVASAIVRRLSPGAAAGLPHCLHGSSWLPRRYAPAPACGFCVPSCSACAACARGWISSKREANRPLFKIFL